MYNIPNTTFSLPEGFYIPSQRCEPFHCFIKTARVKVRRQCAQITTYFEAEADLSDCICMQNYA